MPAAVRQHRQRTKIQDCARRYKVRYPEFFTPPLRGFPKTVEEEFVCRGPTTEGWRSDLTCTNEEGEVVFKDKAAKILHFIRLALRFGARNATTHKGIGEDPSVVLRFSFAESDSHPPQYYVVPPVSYTHLTLPTKRIV